MLSLVYTGKYLLEKRREKLTRDAGQRIYADSQRNLYHVQQLQQLPAPSLENDRIDVDFRVKMPLLGKHLLVGILDTSSLGEGGPSIGIAVAIDLCLGTVVDVLNDTGVLGMVDDSMLEPGKILEISIRLDFRGGHCIPRIILNQEPLLHPALNFRQVETLDLVGGSSLGEGAGAEFILEPATSPDVALS